MSFAKSARSAVIATALAALVGTSMTTSAEARWRGHHGGGLALGIGALVVAGILASQHHRHHRHYYYSSSYYQPYYGYYGHRRHHRHHRHYRRW